MAEYIFDDENIPTVEKIMCEDGLYVVTCASHETAKSFKEFMEMVYEYFVYWYVDANQTIEYSDEEPEFEQEENYDRCVCGDLLTAQGRCIECDIGLRGINQHRY
jgi:hypothetical protein